MNNVIYKPEWSTELHEAIGQIERRTAQRLEQYIKDSTLLTNVCFPIDRVKAALRAGAIESYNAKRRFYESQPEFSPAWLDEPRNETVTDMLDIVPMGLLATSKYREARPQIEEDLANALQTLVVQGPQGPPIRHGEVELVRNGRTQAKEAGNGRPLTSKAARRNKRYVAIDRALLSIAEARPANHKDVFEFLDGRKIALPSREPFRSAGGWLKGYQKSAHGARAWLSHRWGYLNLPAFVPGPKQVSE